MPGGGRLLCGLLIKRTVITRRCCYVFSFVHMFFPQFSMLINRFPARSIEASAHFTHRAKERLWPPPKEGKRFICMKDLTCPRQVRSFMHIKRRGIMAVLFR